VQRATASAIWNRRLAERACDVAITAAAGHNDPSLGPSTHAGLLEAAVMRNDEHTVFARAELVTKSGHDLALAAELAEDTFTVGSFSVGYVHDFPQLGAIVPGFGVVGMIDVIGSALEPIHDTNAARSASCSRFCGHMPSCDDLELSKGPVACSLESAAEPDLRELKLHGTPGLVSAAVAGRRTRVRDPVGHRTSCRQMVRQSQPRWGLVRGGVSSGGGSSAASS
jgi:hypothetical protein